MAEGKIVCNSDLPKDRYNLVYCFLLLHGVGFLLPWNVFINAREYFVDYKLNTTLSFDADYRVNMMSYFGLASHFPSLCFAAWNTFYQGKTNVSDPSRRFICSMILEMLVLIFTIVMALVNTSAIPGIFFTLTILSIVIINCCVGIHQTLTFGLAATLPMKYSNAVIVGANACGAILSTTNIITKYFAIAYGTSEKSIVFAAVAYFLSALLIISACTVTFFWMRKLKFVRYYSSMPERGNVIVHSQKEHPLLIDVCGAELPIFTELNKHVDSNVTCNAETKTKYSEPGSNLLVLPNGTQDDPVSTNCFGKFFKSQCCGTNSCQTYWSKYWITFKICWPQCLNIWCVLFCSLSIFPAIHSQVRPNNPNYFITPTWFVDITCFLTFNLFAMIGSIVGNFIHFPSPRYLWIPIWLRLFFFYGFYLSCNFDHQGTSYIPVIVTNDHVYVLGAILFAFSNGYLAALAVMYASRCPAEYTKLSGMIASFSLSLGVFSGIYASRGLMSLVT